MNRRTPIESLRQLALLALVGLSTGCDSREELPCDGELKEKFESCPWWDESRAACEDGACLGSRRERVLFERWKKLIVETNDLDEVGFRSRVLVDEVVYDSSRIHPFEVRFRVKVSEVYLRGHHQFALGPDTYALSDDQLVGRLEDLFSPDRRLLPDSLRCPASVSADFDECLSGYEADMIDWCAVKVDLWSPPIWVDASGPELSFRDGSTCSTELDGHGTSEPCVYADLTADEFVCDGCCY